MLYPAVAPCVFVIGDVWHVRKGPSFPH